MKLEKSELLGMSGSLRDQVGSDLLMFNPLTPELRKCILPTFQKATV